MIDKLTSYLSQLTGETLSPSQPVRLRSVQRAALAAWARRQTPPVQLTGLAQEAASAETLLGGAGSAEAQAPRAALPNPRVPNTAAPADFGIGIDIEMVDALPEADDLRAHPFYQEHFTPSELAHCIAQRDVRASLCGIWAAKEAILKAGIVALHSRLHAVEIGHDMAGRPNFPGCKLSISHTASIAVAVCVAEPAVRPVASPVRVAAPTPDRPVKTPRRLSYGLAAAGVVLAILAGTVAMMLPI